LTTFDNKRDPLSATLNWTAVKTLFEDSILDVLILLDCCAAASAAPRAGRAVTETIVSCGWENNAPPPGELSFRNALVEVLWEYLHKTISTGTLHAGILDRLKHEKLLRLGGGPRMECRRTPVRISRSKPGVPDIVLCRQPPSAVLVPPDTTSNDSIGTGSSGNVLTTYTINAAGPIEPKDAKEITEANNGRSLTRLALEEDLPHDRKTCADQDITLSAEETAVFYENEKRKLRSC